MFNEILINRYNLIHNVEQVKLKNPKSLICAMVKANAYGVGLKEVVKTIEGLVDYFGVSCFFEAKKVRKYTKKNILVVGALEYKKINPDFSYTCNSLEDLKYLASLNKKIKIHIKINTGMNRYGINDTKEFKEMLNIIKDSSLQLEGIFTHFATTDEYVFCQMKKFNKFINIVKKLKLKVLVHADNSFVNEKYNHNLSMVRIGFNLYNRNDFEFKPVVNIRSKIVQINSIKKGDLVGYDYRFVARQGMKIAVVPVGYADGFDLGYIGCDLNIKGYDCKVLNICMDCFMLDITNTDLKKGDDVYILNHINSLKMYANYINSSPYEIMTKFSNMRAERKFIN